MPSTTRGRQVYANQVVLDQADFFQPDGFTRVTGLNATLVSHQLFFDNQSQPWTLVNGSSVPDSQVVSGKVYFHEIPGQPGCYSVRFRPHAIGYWRLLVTYAPGQQITAQDYDVIASPVAGESGLKASTVKPC